MTYGPVVSDLVGQHAAFLVGAGDAHGSTSLDLRHLANHMAYGAGGSGYKHRVAFLGSTHVQQAEVCCEPVGAQRSQVVIGVRIS